MGAYAAVAVGFGTGHAVRSGFYTLPVVWVVVAGLLAIAAIAAAMGHVIVAGFGWTWGAVRIAATGATAAPLALPLAGACVALSLIVIERHAATSAAIRSERRRLD